MIMRYTNLLFTYLLSYYIVFTWYISMLMNSMYISEE